MAAGMELEELDCFDSVDSVFALRKPVLPSCKRVELTLGDLVIAVTRALLW